MAKGPKRWSCIFLSIITTAKRKQHSSWMEPRPAPSEDVFELNNGSVDLVTGRASTGDLTRDHEEDRWIGGFHREMRATSSIMEEIWAQVQLGYQAHIPGGE